MRRVHVDGLGGTVDLCLRDVGVALFGTGVASPAATQSSGPPVLPYLSRSGESVLDLGRAPYGFWGVTYIDLVSPNLPDADKEVWHDALEGLVDTHGCQHRHTVYSSTQVAQSVTGCWHTHGCSDQGCVFAINTADVGGGTMHMHAGTQPTGCTRRLAALPAPVGLNSIFSWTSAYVVGVAMPVGFALKIGLVAVRVCVGVRGRASSQSARRAPARPLALPPVLVRALGVLALFVP